MLCDNTIILEDMPLCWQTNALIQGLTIPLNATPVIIRLRNMATGRVVFSPQTSGGAGEIVIEMDDIAPLMKHSYEVTITDTDLNPVDITIGSETGEKIQFGTINNVTPQATITL